MLSIWPAVCYRGEQPLAVFFDGVFSGPLARHLRYEGQPIIDSEATCQGFPAVASDERIGAINPSIPSLRVLPAFGVVIVEKVRS